MAQIWDKQPGPKGDDSAHPLPKPELNPATNPLLAKNLGRWAQVYFTHPPEEREQAVAELLRELEAALHEIQPHMGSPSAQDQTSRHEIVCPACSYANPLPATRCESCSAELKTVTARRYSAATQLVAREMAAPASPSMESVAHSDATLQRLREQALAASDQPPGKAFPMWNLAVVAGIVLLLAGLSYVRRGAPNRPAAGSALQSSAANQANPAHSGTVAGTALAPDISETRDVNGNSSQTTSGVDDAAQDLQLAQRLLAGTRAPRDPAEAANHLWKAVAKHNSRAAILLADLYTRGDGVPQSCDQARLLLKATAERGNAEAKGKLDDLESVCH